MTTGNHLNNFVKLDSEIQEKHSKTADELLKVDSLDFENTLYLAKLLFTLERYDESIGQFKRLLTLKSNNKETLTFIGICYFEPLRLKEAGDS